MWRRHDRATVAPDPLMVMMAVVMALLTALAGTPAGAAAPGHTPVVLFPAFHFTKLGVTVRNQTVAPACPRSGSFEDWFQNDHPSTTFSQVCQDRLLTLDYDRSRPMTARFSDVPGVRVGLVDYSSTRSAPFYEPLYRALEGAGYVRDKDIRVAGYDSRLTPDMDGFLSRTVELVEDTYRTNGNRAVHLVGHSNGPLYAQYLLTHTSRAWRDIYIAGFTPIAGNLPGQGSTYSLLFTGLNIRDFSCPATRANAASSARMYLTAPSTYMSMADPGVFGRREDVLQNTATGVAYTPQDYPRLFLDARLPLAAEIGRHYIGFVKFRGPSSFPYVDSYAEKGSGISTAVGVRLKDLTAGQVLGSAPDFITRDGDGNQEDITNEAVRAWRAMPCFRFGLTDNPGVDHFSLPGDPNVLARLLEHLTRPPSPRACHTSE